MDAEEGRCLKVLIVDDEPVNRLVLARMIEHLGSQCLEAASGPEALELLRQQPVDLVLMDIQMPVMDGITATRQIRARERALGRRPIPIIAITANTAGADLANYRAAGMTDTVAKPINPRELLSTIAAALAQSHAKAAATG